MRAIVFATGATSMRALTESRPAPLLPALDRPFLQHVLEHLIDHGVQTFDLILSEHPAEIESYLETGKRWGCEIRYHLARNASSPFSVLSTIVAAPERVFVADADRLPLLPKELSEAADPAALVDRKDRWSGWALIPGDLLVSLAGAPTWADAEAIVRRAARPLEVPIVLSIAGYGGLLDTNRMMLEGRFPMPLLTARQVEEGIWISRNVSLHPTARLMPPVFIGENCRIGEEAQIGPMAVLGHDSVLDRQSMVKDSLILPGSYVGEALDLENSIVDRGKLINVTLGAELAIGEAFLLGSVSGRDKSRAHRLAGRALAALLLVIFSPLLLLVLLGRALFGQRPIVSRQQNVRLPAPSDPDRWETISLPALTAAPPTSAMAHFVLCFLPGLLSVVIGRVGLAGVPPRTREQIEALPEDWRTMYLRSRAGLVSEAFVLHGAGANSDDEYAAELFYAVSSGVRLDFSILMRYAGRILGFGVLKAKSRSAAGGAS